MTWFDIIKNIITVKIYDSEAPFGTGRGMYVPENDNQGWAGEISAVLATSEKLYDVYRTDRSSLGGKRKGEIQTSVTYMGVPLIAIYKGSQQARGFPEYVELRQPLPEYGVELYIDIAEMWKTLKNQTMVELNRDKNWANAITGQFPSDLEQYKQQLTNETKRMGGVLGRFKKPRM